MAKRDYSNEGIRVALAAFATEGGRQKPTLKLLRAAAYGDALEDAERFAHIASAVTGCDIRPEHFPLILLASKLSRASQTRWHRDSWVDIAGYARVAEKIFDRQCELDDIADAQRAVEEFEA